MARQSRGSGRGSGQRSGKPKAKIGKKEIKAKDLEFRLGGQSNIDKFSRRIEDIRHGMAKKSKSKYPQDIEYVLKHLKDPEIDDEAIRIRKEFSHHTGLFRIGTR